MAKKSMIAREIKRQKTVERFAAKRAELKKIIADSQSSDEDKFAAREKLQKLPRDANPIRLQRRCQITGRPHACLLYTSPSPRDAESSRMPSSA